MSWLDRLLPASFRGVPFNVVDNSKRGGRRVAVNEYPEREVGTVEDVGRRTPRFRIEAFVVGDDFYEKRDALEDVLEARGTPGLLVHPTRGEMVVSCVNYEVLETTRQGRVATFTIDFVEAQVDLFPRRVQSGASQLRSAADEIGEAAALLAENKLALVGVPEEVRTSAAARIRELGQFLEGLDIFSGPIEEAAVMGRAVSDLINRGVALATGPASLVSSVFGALLQVKASANNTRGILAAYEALGLFRFIGKNGSSSGVGLTIDANTGAIESLVHQVALAEAASAAAIAEWETLDEAESAKARLSAQLSAALLDAPAEMVATLGALRAGLARALPPEDRNLPRLRTIRTRATTTTIALAYEIYGDVSREPEIRARNKFPHPGFVPGGTDVEVIVAE